MSLIFKNKDSHFVKKNSQFKYHHLAMILLIILFVLKNKETV